MAYRSKANFGSHSPLGLSFAADYCSMALMKSFGLFGFFHRRFLVCSTGFGVLFAAMQLSASLIDDFEYGLLPKVISSPLDLNGWTLVEGDRLELVSVPGGTTPNGTRFAMARPGGVSATKLAALSGTQLGFTLEADFLTSFSTPNISLAPAAGSPQHPGSGPEFGITSSLDPKTQEPGLFFYIRPPGGPSAISQVPAGLSWMRLRLVIDPSGFDGGGAGFLFMKPRFPDGTMIAIPGLQNVPLGFRSPAVAGPSTWSMVWMKLDSFCLMDNIEATTMPLVRLWALEVTQSVQDWINSVPLIEGKETYVRAFAEATSATDVGRALKGKLHGFRNGTELPSSPLAPMRAPSVTLTADAQALRGSILGSLNFELPTDWTSNRLSLSLEVEDFALEDAPLAGAGGPSSGTLTVQFKPSGKPKIAVFPLNYSSPFSPSLPLASVGDIADSLEWIRRMYPMTEFDVEWSPAVTYWHPIPPGPTALFSDVSMERLVHPSWIAEGRIALGLVSEQAWQASTAGSVAGMGGFLGADAAWFVAGVDGTVGYQTTAAHELGHVLGRPHPVSPIFAGVPSVGSALPVRFGACGEVAYVPVETFPWFLPMNCSISPIPGPKPTLGPMGLGEPRKMYGFDPVMHPALVANNPQEAVLNPDCYFEMMSYCEFGSSWVSDHTYKNLLQPILARFGPPPGPVPPRLSVSPQGLGLGDEYVLAQGALDLSSGSVSWISVEQRVGGSPTPSVPGASYQLEALNADGVVLASVGLALTPLPDAERSGNVNEAPFLASLPANASISQIILRKGNSVLSTLQASAHSPEVRILSPSAGEVVEGTAFEVRWAASDPDGDALRYRVEYSPDTGLHWLTLGAQLVAKSLTIDPHDLPGSSQGLFRVWAGDGFHSVSALTDGTVRVPDHGPVLAVLQPREGSILESAAATHLHSFVFDREERDIPEAQLEWRSDVQGVLGRGHDVSLKPLSLDAGLHRITLTARDHAGNVTTVSRQIVVRDVDPPVLTFAGWDDKDLPKLGVHTPVPCRILLEASTDLKDWVLVESFDQRDLDALRPLPLLSKGGHQFFRGRSEPLGVRFLKQPTSVAQLSGSDLMIYSEVDGTALRYQWYRNGSQVPNANTSSLRIAGTQPSDSGIFQLVIRNGSGSTTSAPVQVTILSAAYEVLHHFGTNSLDGVNGWGRLALGPDGFLYGCARNGANAGAGAVFKMAQDGKEYHVLHRFDASKEGANPSGGVLIASDGRLYGTCNLGGTNNSGTVWVMKADGSEFAVLHHFSSSADCRNPEAEPMEASDGKLYGTGYNGGGSARGGVFTLSKTGAGYSVLNGFNFGGNAAPRGPLGGLVEGPNGQLYGTTEFGGVADKGSLFCLSRDGQIRSVIASLGTVADGAMNPSSSLLLASDGRLYGTTYAGGINGAGAIYRVALDGTAFARLTSFPVDANGLKEPRAALVQAPDGSFLGTTRVGGAAGQGGVFRLTAGGDALSTSLEFTGLNGDGARSRGPLLRVAGGVYYGTTFGGGSQDRGTVFRILIPDP